MSQPRIEAATQTDSEWEVDPTFDQRDRLRRLDRLVNQIQKDDKENGESIYAQVRSPRRSRNAFVDSSSHRGNDIHLRDTKQNP